VAVFISNESEEHVHITQRNRKLMKQSETAIHVTGTGDASLNICTSGGAFVLDRKTWVVD
jgi:hypothetical protein